MPGTLKDSIADASKDLAAMQAFVIFCNQHSKEDGVKLHQDLMIALNASEKETRDAFDQKMLEAVLEKYPDTGKKPFRGNNEIESVWFLQKLKDAFDEKSLAKFRECMLSGQKQEVLDLVQEKIQKTPFLNQLLKKFLKDPENLAIDFVGYVIFQLDRLSIQPENLAASTQMETLRAQKSGKTDAEKQALDQRRSISSPYIFRSCYITIKIAYPTKATVGCNF